ncbi:CCA tRNA nucleotidyltransferase [Aquibacillus albus]|nr:CCA tRNA nucleotidyltransferase [Aquibacillus albus]
MLGTIFQRAIEVLEIFEKHGHKAFIVGGAVRDYQMGRNIGDIDITTSATPNEVLKLFAKVIPVGIEHGTVIVRYKKESFEVTTFRVEGDYSDYRHPDHVQFVDNLEADLARRDFTINAMAMDRYGNIIDPFNGSSDLSKHCIRAVGVAEERFSEDPLRMMRAIRFASQLGFVIEKETLGALCENVELIGRIAIERIAVEFLKMFNGQYIANGITLVTKTKMLNFFPVFKDNPRLQTKIRKHEATLFSYGELIAVLHLYDECVSIDEWVKTWKLSNQVRNEAKILSNACKYYFENGLTKWLVYTIPPQCDEGFIRLITVFGNEKSLISIEKLRNIRSELPILSNSQLAINGKDIIELKPNYPKGPWIKQCLAEIEKNVVEAKLINNQNNIREWVKKWNPPEID